MSDVAIEAMENGADLFADSVEEEPADTAQEQPEEPTEETTEEPTEENEPEDATPKAGIKVKFNHEERELTLEEARELAEKGLALDKTRAELETLKSAREFKILDAYAARNNMTREQYLEFAQRRADEDEAAPVVRQLMEAGTPEAVARELALRRLQETRGQARRQQEQQAAQTREEQQRNAEAEKQAGYRALVDYANQNGIDLSKLPQEVLRDINAGMKPLEAYLRYENASLRLERSQREQNEKNKDKNPGRVNDKAPAAVKDPFDDAFDEVFGL